VVKLWGIVASLVFCFGKGATEPALDPTPVCEVVTNRKDFEGKTVAVMGRYSFRRTGRWLDQESCEGKPERGALTLIEDTKNAPKVPEPIEIDQTSFYRKLAVMKQHTALGKFRFGSPDYDRWAVMYGRIENRKEGELQLVYRGDGAMFFFVER
jgi:hypothetical protein